MMNLRFNKMILMGKYSRLSVLLCMLLVSITGSAGNYFYYQYNVTVAPNSSNTGLGKVYLDATANSYYENGNLWSQTLKDNKQIVDFKESTTLTLSVSQKNENKTNQKNPYIEYTSVTLRAEALDGSVFTGWTWNDGSSTDATISVPCPERKQMKKNDDDDTQSADCPNTYIAHFTARTYYYQSPGAIALDGAMVYISTNGVRPEDDDTDKWKTNIPTGTTQSKSADGNGQYARATISYYFHAKAPDGNFELLGWYDTNGNEVVLGDNGRYDLVATSENSAAPTTIVLTPKFMPSNPYTTITKTNLPEVQLYTGVEGTNNVFPYSPKKQIDLSKIFGNDNKALFDSLYIFGETFSADGKPLVGEMGAGYPVTYATAIPNAITPCYVYMKSDENTYTLRRTIQNMNPKSTVNLYLTLRLMDKNFILQAIALMHPVV